MNTPRAPHALQLDEISTAIKAAIARHKEDGKKRVVYRDNKTNEVVTRRAAPRTKAIQRFWVIEDGDLHTTMRGVATPDNKKLTPPRKA